MTLKDKNLYYVGGVVRDEILGTASFDTDFCYEGDAIEFAKKSGLNIIKENPDFGTVRVLLDHDTSPQPRPYGVSPLGEGVLVDIASTREEDYPSPGHLPVVKNIGCSLKNDLKRRDFTINAMAKNTLTGEIVDYFGGMEDIKNKKLRVLHKNSFIDDPTRIIRALKFAVRFSFELDEETKRLQDEYLSNVNYDMSYHRLKKELKETFNLNREEAYRRFVKDEIYKLLGRNQPSPQPSPPEREFAKLVERYSPTHAWLVYLGGFDLTNIELTGDEKRVLDSVPQGIPCSDFETYKMFKNIPVESILLYSLQVDYKTAIHYLEDLKDIKIEITGEDLKKLGIPNGKIYKDIFDFVLDTKLKKPNMNKTEELEIVRSKYGIS